MRPSTTRRLAALGAVWSLLFAALHFYWGTGGRLGVPSSADPITSRPWFLAYDLAAGVIFAAAAMVGLILASESGSETLRRRMLTATTWGATVALLRGFGGLVADAITAAGGRPPGVGVLYDAWFAVAGLLFCLTSRGLRHPRCPIISTAARRNCAANPDMTRRIERRRRA